MVQTLNRLRGHPLDEPIETSTRVRDLGAPVPAAEKIAIDDAVARSPELATARLGVTASERSVSLARKSYYPDLTVSAGIMPRGGDFPPMWLLSVGGALPVFAGSKQNRAADESAARAVASRRSVDAIEQVLKLRVSERRTALGALAETIRLFQEGLLIQSEATAESTLAQYQVGKVSFASVLEANAGYIADEDAYLQAIADAQRIAIATAEVSLDPVTVSGVAPMAGAAMPGAGSTGGGGVTGAATESSVGATTAGADRSKSGM